MTSEIPFVVTRNVLYRPGDAVRAGKASGVITRIERQISADKRVTWHVVLSTAAGEVRRSANSLRPDYPAGS